MKFGAPVWVARVGNNEWLLGRGLSVEWRDGRGWRLLRGFIRIVGDYAADSGFGS